MWDRPGSGIKLVSHALQGGFLATGSSGKPIIFFSIKLAQHSSLKLHVSSSGCIGLMWLSYLAVPRMLKMWKDPWTPCTAKMKEGLYASGNFPLIVVGPVCHESPTKKKRPQRMSLSINHWAGGKPSILIPTGANYSDNVPSHCHGMWVVMVIGGKNWERIIKPCGGRRGFNSFKPLSNCAKFRLLCPLLSTEGIIRK